MVTFDGGPHVRLGCVAMVAFVAVSVRLGEESDDGGKPMKKISTRKQDREAAAEGDEAWLKAGVVKCSAVMKKYMCQLTFTPDDANDKACVVKFCAEGDDNCCTVKEKNELASDSEPVDACGCPEGEGWSKSQKKCKKDHTTSPEEAKICPKHGKVCAWAEYKSGKITHHQDDEVTRVFQDSPSLAACQRVCDMTAGCEAVDFNPDMHDSFNCNMRNCNPRTDKSCEHAIEADGSWTVYSKPCTPEEPRKLTYPDIECESKTKEECKNILGYKGDLQADEDWIDGCFAESRPNSEPILFYNERPGATTGHRGGDRICAEDPEEIGTQCQVEKGLVQGEPCLCVGKVYFGHRFSEGKPGEEDSHELSLKELKKKPHAMLHVDGEIVCSNEYFGDPYVGLYKQCICVPA